MQPEKLNREQEHAINANAGDRLYLWDSFGEKQNLTIQAGTHNNVLTVCSMIRPITVESTIHFRRRGRGSRKEMCNGERPAPERPPGRVPRISRFMALAIRFEGLIQAGEVADYAELARLGHVTRARITQIMNLRLLAPDIQEHLLCLPLIEGGRQEIHLRQLQPIAAVADWRNQRRLCSRILSRSP